MQKKNTNRMDRVDEEFKRELSKIIDQDLKNPNITGLISVTKVKTVVHCNLNPENIILSANEGRVKLIDIGIVDVKYNPNTRHYAQADCPGTGDYVRGMICGVENNAKTPKSERESAQTIALRDIEKMSKKNLGTSAREIARNRSN